MKKKSFNVWRTTISVFVSILVWTVLFSRKNLFPVISTYRAHSAGHSWMEKLETFAATFRDKPAISTDMARACFSNSSWLLLGDSTMTELMHDLALLISWTSEINATLEYYDKATRFPGPGINTPDINAYILAKSVSDRETIVRFYANHRNATVVSENIFLRHRFIGHRSLDGDAEGVAALAWLLDEDKLMKDFVRSADVILLNSAAHDCARNKRDPQPDWLAHFARTLDDSIGKLQTLNPHARVWYKKQQYGDFSGLRVQPARRGSAPSCCANERWVY